MDKLLIAAGVALLAIGAAVVLEAKFDKFDFDDGVQAKARKLYRRLQEIGDDDKLLG